MIRLGIVGLGMAVTPHAKSLLDLKHRAQVAYAYSRSPERRAKFAERFPFPQCDRLETILEDRSIDAVLVLTPPNTHLEIVERCARAGKHVLLEKPLEISTDKAERIVQACKKVKLGVVLQHRFRPAAEKLRENMVVLGLSQSRLREQVEGLVERMNSRLVTPDPAFQKIAELLPKAATEMKTMPIVRRH